MKINNEIYEEHGHEWWAEDAGFDISSLRYCVNPVRYGYFKKKLRNLNLSGKKVLDLGCGGGFLAEEFAKDGLTVMGIDPATRCIEAARHHAAESNLSIDYRIGKGEALPFPDDSFDIIACCDVLEHVDDPHTVIREAARTLRRGGVFCYDTINRTWLSKIVAIKILQDWRITRLFQPNVHVWEKFIKPGELDTMMRSCHLVNQDRKGIGPARRNPMVILRTLLLIKKCRIRHQELTDRLGLCETEDVNLSYMGFAIKDSGELP